MIYAVLIITRWHIKIYMFFRKIFNPNHGRPGRCPANPHFMGTGDWGLGTGGMGMGGESFSVWAQSFHRAPCLSSPYRHVSPFEMKDGLQLTIKKIMEKGL